MKSALERNAYRCCYYLYGGQSFRFLFHLAGVMFVDVFSPLTPRVSVTIIIIYFVTRLVVLYFFCYETYFTHAAHHGKLLTFFKLRTKQKIVPLSSQFAEHNLFPNIYFFLFPSDAPVTLHMLFIYNMYVYKCSSYVCENIHIYI